MANVDDWTVSHLNKWLHSEFTCDAIVEHNMESRMLAIYNDDPEFWGRQSWWNVFDAAKIDRLAR